MSDNLAKIRKALKLLNVVKKPTGNKHYDSLALETFNRYCEKHNIDQQTINSLTPVVHDHKYQDRLEAELFLMISIKEAEVRNMLNNIDITLDQSGGFTYKGPAFFYDEVFPLFNKFLRKYQIQREAVKENLKRQSVMPYYTINSMGGGTITIFGNITSPPIKYSETVFYNAFLIKYDLIAQSVIEKLRKEKPVEKPVDMNLRNDLQQMMGMFNKESINDQIDHESNIS